MGWYSQKKENKWRQHARCSLTHDVIDAQAASLSATHCRISTWHTPSSQTQKIPQRVRVRTTRNQAPAQRFRPIKCGMRKRHTIRSVQSHGEQQQTLTAAVQPSPIHSGISSTVLPQAAVHITVALCGTSCCGWLVHTDQHSGCDPITQHQHENNIYNACATCEPH